MRAKLKGLYSPDIDDLKNWSPQDEQFGIALEAMIGPSDTEGQDSFSLELCTPAWFASNRMDTGIIMGSRTLFVSQYNYRQLWSYLERAAQRAEGADWRDVAEKLSWIGTWEFEDYVPYES